MKRTRVEKLIARKLPRPRKFLRRRAFAPLAASLVLSLSCGNEPPSDDPPSGGSGAGGSGGPLGGMGGAISGNSGNGAGGAPGGSGGVIGGTGGGPLGGTGGVAGGGGGSGTGGGTGGSAGAGGACQLPPGVLGHPKCGVDYPVREGFTLTLVEEFEEPMNLDSDPIWTWSDGGLPEGNVRFVKDNVVVENGVLKLIAKQGPVPTGFSHAEEGQVGEKPLSSGELRTKYNNFRYGRYEARMKVPTLKGDPALNGNFIATFFAFRTPKFQEWREIDIEVTGDSPNSVGTNLIFGDGVSNYPETRNAFQSFNPTINARTEFHTYGFEWTPGQVVYFVNDQVIRTATPAPAPAPDVPSESAKIILNLWIFNDTCDFGGRECQNNIGAYPFHTEYDWIRFYKWNDEATYPCANPPTCLSDADLDGSKNNPTDGVPDIPPS